MNPKISLSPSWGDGFGLKCQSSCLPGFFVLALQMCFILDYVYVCICMGMCLWPPCLWRPEEGTECSGAQVTRSHEPSVMVWWEVPHSSRQLSHWLFVMLFGRSRRVGVAMDYVTGSRLWHFQAFSQSQDTFFASCLWFKIWALSLLLLTVFSSYPSGSTA